MPAFSPLPIFRWDSPARILPMLGNPAPQGGAVGYATGRGGVRLRIGVYGAQGKVRGTVLVMTGYSECLEKYFETLRDLQAEGFATVLMEWRGHGLSARALARTPARLHIRDLDVNLADLEIMRARILSAMPRPHFGLAHSMGGQIALRALARHADWFAALSLSAPMLGLPMAPRALRAVEAWAGFWGALGWDAQPIWGAGRSRRAGRIAHNQVTSDGTRFARNEGLMQLHPELMVNQVSLGFVRAAARAMRASLRAGALEKLATPMLIGQAEEEQIVCNATMVRAAVRLARARLVTYRGARHEILMERDEIRRAFLRDSIALFAAHA